MGSEAANHSNVVRSFDPDIVIWLKPAMREHACSNWFQSPSKGRKVCAVLVFIVVVFIFFCFPDHVHFRFNGGLHRERDRQLRCGKYLTRIFQFRPPFCVLRRVLIIVSRFMLVAVYVRHRSASMGGLAQLL